MTLKDKTVVVTGGSRGLGLGVVEAVVAAGAKVTVVARDAADLAAVAGRLGVATERADITDAEAAADIVGRLRPDILVLNAGAVPPMKPLDQMTWDEFSTTWETDVKGGLYWIQAALKAPLAPGSRVLVGSSGAAVQGSPLSGGYAGAKRMLWLMAKYAGRVSDQRSLGLRFQAIIPRQMIGGTGVGDAGAAGYSRAQGVTPEAFLAGFGEPMPPRRYGELVVGFLQDDALASAPAVTFRGDAGAVALDDAA
ncbi:SDR family oxidoreductase [Caulobacter sp. 1776]|uniref:SDR family oxidoreductase n=1 Tax=Caulobacter sp. 1776 TaxID=3156420 RepID=UPI003393EC40